MVYIPGLRSSSVSCSGVVFILKLKCLVFTAVLPSRAFAASSVYPLTVGLSQREAPARASQVKLNRYEVLHLELTWMDSSINMCTQALAARDPPCPQQLCLYST